MDSGPDSLFGYRLREAGLTSEVVFEMPLVRRPLSLWKLNNEEAETKGLSHFGDRFLSINFNKFCRSPDVIIGRVYKRLGVETPSFGISSIHPPLAPEWNKFFDELQIDRQWLADGQAT